MTLRRFKTWMLPLCAAALLLAGGMLYHALSGGQLVGCGAGSGCDSVTGSPWAWVLGGVPVSLPAIVVWLLLGICVLFLEDCRSQPAMTDNRHARPDDRHARPDNRHARPYNRHARPDRASPSLNRIIWPLMLFLSGCIVGAALWFGYLQAFVLHAFCKYCSALHLLGCVGAGIILYGDSPVKPANDEEMPANDEEVPANDEGVPVNDEGAFRHSPIPVSRHSPILVSRHSPSPISRYSPTPISRHSPTPISRHSPTPVSRHSPTPIGESRPWLCFAAGLAAAALFAFVQSRTLPDAVYDAGRTEALLPTFDDGEVPVLEGDSPVKPANDEGLPANDEGVPANDEGVPANDEKSEPGMTDTRHARPDRASLTLLFDFQCIHCRRLHRILPELLEKSGGQYRILLCPVPLSSACNPYIPSSGVDRFAGSCELTRYALAVWYTRPEAWAAYWDYLLGDGDAQLRIRPEEAAQRARELLPDGLDAALQDPRIDAYLRKVEELFGRSSTSGKSGVPRLICGQRWMVPETDDPDALLTLLHQFVL